MIPVVTPAEMRAIDDAAEVSVEVLIGRAGAEVARAAIDMLAGTYGRVVNVLAGRGNNGADGRDAARRLRARGVQVRLFDVASCPAVLPPADLVIDAAFGTGFSSDRSWTPPEVGGAPVLAVDIPSGVDGLTGLAGPAVLAAERTVTFQALKPGLLFGSGASLAGDVRVVDIGLDTSHIGCHLVEAADVVGWWPRRAVDAHKWRGALKVIAGSTAMPGAAELCTAAAMRGGSGLVSLSAPGAVPRTRSEIVQHHVELDGFASAALADIERFGALVIGPGLGRAERMLADIRECVAAAPVPTVIDGDAIAAIAGHGTVCSNRVAATVITPHDGEFERLTGAAPGTDRIAATRAAAGSLGVTILLKGPTTVVADATGRVLLVDLGDQRLATAGSGDVLAGLIGAALAGGAEPIEAAAAAAWLHASAADRCRPEGMLAGDIIEALPAAIGALR